MWAFPEPHHGSPTVARCINAVVPYCNEGEAETLGNRNTPKICLVASNLDALDFGDAEESVDQGLGRPPDQALASVVLVEPIAH